MTEAEHKAAETILQPLKSCEGKQIAFVRKGTTQSTFHETEKVFLHFTDGTVVGLGGELLGEYYKRHGITDLAGQSLLWAMDGVRCGGERSL